MKRYLRFAINLILVLVVYYVLSYFNLVTWYLILGVILLIGVFVYFQVRITDHELYLEIVCNTTMYLRRLERSSDAKRDTDSYRLGLAYAAMYQGDVEKMTKHINRVDETRLPNLSRQFPIYIRIRARVAYEQQNLAVLDQLLDQLDAQEQPKLVGYVTLMKLLLHKQYDDQVVLLKELIPDEVIRLHLIELEYYLALAYKEIGQTDDALAVLEFIVKKGYGIIHTDWAYETYIKIKDNQLENSISQ